MELSILIMAHRYFYIFFFLIGSFPLFAQLNGGSIQVSRNNRVEDLVTDVFLKGNCKNVSNIEGNGEPVSFGEFENAGNIIGFPDGILLSTGNVELAEGPNESVETSDRFGKSSNDRDLRAIATNQLFDVTILEFDFVPLADQVSFQYVFASEEYCEFVGTIFNDVFGFFVSGPGIDGPFENGAINVARLPDSEEFVSINTVNHELNSDSYVKNELQADANNCQVFFNPNHVNTIEYDGFTVPLIARFEVIPCETYHIRLLVGDVGDDKLDSAVFLRSKSFDLGELATVKAVVPNRSDTIAYENCVDGQFVFTRPPNTDRNVPFPIDFIIDDNSTATEGIDFQAIQSSITIPAGQNSISLPIQSLVDNETENIETLTLDLQQTCKCEGGSNATLKIADARPPELSFRALAACADQSFTIRPQINAGVAPFTFEWSNSTTDSILTDLVQQPNSYILTVTDFCQNSTVDSVSVNIQAIPMATLSGEVDFCEGLPMTTLPLNFTGNAPWSFTYTIDNNEPILMDNVLDNNFALPINQAGNYQLVAFSDAACTGVANGIGKVVDIGFQLDIETIPPNCPNSEDGQIALTLLEGQAPFSINWSTVVNNELRPSGLSAGNYEVTIMDAQSCSISTTINLPNPSMIAPDCVNNRAYIPNVFSPNGDGINDFFEIFFPENSTVQKIKSVRIMDRWGNLVYAVAEIFPSWDGSFQGKNLNPAVFQYQIILALDNGRTEIIQGDVTLIR